MADIPVNYDNSRPKVCAFFSGRVWYAGIESNEKNGWILFTQVATDLNKFEKCYQEGDPTSEVFSDLADNDGGVIVIPDAGEIVELKQLGPSLVVFATNGVWQIIGTDQGFKATSYSVDKVSNVGCLGSKTVVEVEESILYWTNTGVSIIKLDQSGLADIKNISDTVIKTLYQGIPVLNKFYAEGAYNSVDKIVWWGFNKDPIESTSAGRYSKNRILCLDMRLGAWYVYDIANGSPIAVSIAVTQQAQETTQEYNVIVNADILSSITGNTLVLDFVTQSYQTWQDSFSALQEVVSGTDNVIVDIPVVNSSSKRFKFLTLHPVTSNDYSVTWSELRDTTFKDWYSYNSVGLDSPAYILTGYSMGGNGPARNKTGGYVSVFMKRTETVFDVNTNPLNPSGCLMQTRWDFTDNSYTGKWSDEYQVYRQLRPFFAEPSTPFDDGYPLVITKNKIRGRGKALQMKWSSEPGKDMKIVGWSTTFANNTNV